MTSRVKALAHTQPNEVYFILVLIGVVITINSTKRIKFLAIGAEDLNSETVVF